jgi:enamine deaminase RidA (YjgF/YER057c/UK114 family)
MNHRIDQRLAELGLTLPEPMAAVANYVPFVRQGDLLFVSGQISSGPDGLITGKLGTELDLAAGQAAARLCALNLLAQARSALSGDLSRIVRVVKLGGFVNAAPDFIEIPKVINGCSDLMVDVLGEAGRHARSAVACPTLPLGAAVEIDAILAVRD